MKKQHKVLLLLFLSLFLSACGRKQKLQTEKYAIVTKSSENSYNDRIVDGFREVIEANGKQCLVRQPERMTAEEQVILIEELIRDHVKAIAVAANDAEGLNTVLEDAKREGIKVVTFDSNTSEGSHVTFVNQASVKQIGKVLIEAVYEMSGGEGQWAILSTTSQAVNQNEWIDAMKLELEDDKYKNLRLVDISYGEDEYTVSTNCTRRLLENYPDLKVICAPTVVGLRAACQVVSQEGWDRSIKVTGLGLPSQMKDYIGSGGKKVCPYMYLWNPEKLGSVTAYTAMELVGGEITGAEGESFVMPDAGRFYLVRSQNGGSEIVVGEPIRFDEKNIDKWKDQF